VAYGFKPVDVVQLHKLQTSLHRPVSVVHPQSEIITFYIPEAEASRQKPSVTSRVGRVYYCPMSFEPLSMASTQPAVPVANVQPTPPRSHKQYHRLLYRGSLSLPDSDVILDGTGQPPTTIQILILSFRNCFHSPCTSHLSDVTLGISASVGSRIDARSAQSTLCGNCEPARNEF
jgi:hypothetical protein